MIINLNRLNESLDRLYESKPSLTEAFDESFPKWLKDRLLVINKYHTGDYAARRNIPWNERPDYINARDESRWNSSTRSLWEKALAAGIDFSKTKVVEGPVPEKRTDERLKNENFIPIWLFPNGQVYIEGLNGSEIYQTTGKAFKYMPMKDKIENAEGFAYIDKTNIDPEAITGKRKARASLRADIMNNVPEYARKGTPDFKKFGRDFWGTEYDKSGYPILNPERYQKEIEKLAGKKIYQVLEEFHNKIIDAQRKVAEVYSQEDPFSSETDIDKISNLINSIRWAASRYNDYMRKVDRIINSSWDEDYKARELGELVRRIKHDDYMQSIENIGSQIFLSEIDWD